MHVRSWKSVIQDGLLIWAFDDVWVDNCHLNSQFNSDYYEKCMFTIPNEEEQLTLSPLATPAMGKLYISFKNLFEEG